MRYQLSGTRDGVPWGPPGSEYDLPDAEAAKYCANGIAEAVAQRAKAETATAPAAEERDEPAPKTGGLTTKDLAPPEKTVAADPELPKRRPGRPRKSS